MITGTGLTGRRQRGGEPAPLKRGHHAAEKWLSEAGRAPEVFIAGELLALGGREVLQTLLHEAAHAVGARRGIKTTSSQGNRWHNKRFAQLARELGLQPPERAEPVRGFSRCTLTEETVRRYAAVVRGLDQAGLPFLDGAGAAGVDDPKPKKDPAAKTGGKRRGVECACEPPRRLQLTPKSLADGPIVCGLCDQAFAPPPGDDDQAVEGGADKPPAED
ncbi:hypothetical protein [Kitasatospora sp. KL5]|uniref:hypothetical protein n=1 Tax=Kitasatospora sp. KL5 TaxID=3425125 RepID=UPI003D6F5EBF